MRVPVTAAVLATTLVLAGCTSDEPEADDTAVDEPEVDDTEADDSEADESVEALDDSDADETGDDDGGAADDEAEGTGDDLDETADADAEEVNDETDPDAEDEQPTEEGELDDGPPDPERVSFRGALRSPTDAFQEQEFDGGASLAFVDDSYRMTSGGGPLVAPLMEEAAAGVTHAEVSVAVGELTTPGLTGAACGIDRTGAYLFVGGVRADGEPYYSIGRLDGATGQPFALRDSNLDETPDPGDVIPTDGAFTIGGRCEPGDGPDDALLYLMVDGEEIASVRADMGPPTGQVGLFANGQSDEPFVVDMNDFLMSGSFD